jgi:hypothetical protein
MWQRPARQRDEQPGRGRGEQGEHYPAPHYRQGRAEQQHRRAGQDRELPRLAQRPGEQDGRAQDRPDRGRSRAG